MVIDWWALSANGLWISGLSLLVATIGYQWSRAQTEVPALRDQVPSVVFIRLWRAGLILVCVGWALGQAAHWWDRTLLSLVAAWLVLSWRAGEGSRHQPE